MTDIIIVQFTSFTSLVHFVFFVFLFFETPVSIHIASSSGLLPRPVQRSDRSRPKRGLTGLVRLASFPDFTASATAVLHRPLTLPRKNALTTSLLGSHKSALQTASRLVQPFLQGSPKVTNRERSTTLYSVCSSRSLSL